MRKDTTVLANLLSHLDRCEFEHAVTEHNGDRWVRHFTTFDLLKTRLYGQVTSAFSLREIESSLAVNSTKLYHCGLTPVKRSTLGDALEKRNQKIFEKAFQSLVAKAQLIAGNQGRRFKNPLKIIDASSIELCLKRFDWATFRKTKGAVKLHAKIDGDYLYPEEVRLTSGDVHEINELESLSQESGNIYVMDRGYVDYKKLYGIELRKAFFVTRMKTNCQHEIQQTLAASNDAPVRLDAAIMLTSQKGKKSYPILLRKICYHDAEYDRNYVFISNNFELSAQDIADIYKTRWQVELFFKWLKQNLKIKTFWGNSSNAVYTQIWIALIISILLWIHKTIDGITVSAQRLLQILKTTLFSRKTILELLQYEDPPPKVVSDQLCFQGMKN
jgi:hypothetical protein